jgi:hypothetical protein
MPSRFPPPCATISSAEQAEAEEAKKLSTTKTRTEINAKIRERILGQRASLIKKALKEQGKITTSTGIKLNEETAPFLPFRERKMYVSQNYQERLERSGCKTADTATRYQLAT